MKKKVWHLEKAKTLTRMLGLCLKYFVIPYPIWFILADSGIVAEFGTYYAIFFMLGIIRLFEFRASYYYTEEA